MCPVRFKFLDAGNNAVYNQTATIASIEPDQTVMVIFRNATVPAGNYTTEAIAELPGDQNPPNDILAGSVTVSNPLSGPYPLAPG